MKNIFTFLLISVTAISFSQAYSGKGDQKGQVGFSAQNGGTGINVSYDSGIGENISIGVSSVYLLNSNNGAYNLNFEDRFDVKARFNANIGNVLKLPANVDIYPGLNLGLRNFGAHLGARYFFTDGFGIFTEAGIPLAKYDKSQNLYNNQFVFNIGASFNL